MNITHEINKLHKSISERIKKCVAGKEQSLTIDTANKWIGGEVIFFKKNFPGNQTKMYYHITLTFRKIHDSFLSRTQNSFEIPTFLLYSLHSTYLGIFHMRHT